jgi:hypothetical protein
MGTLMVEPRPAADWTQISSQNRWHGVIFSGHPQARLVPQCQAADNRVAFNAQWSVQSRGTLICQKLKTSQKTKAMRVWFPSAGLTNRQAVGDWTFVEAPQAFAAVRVVSGGTTWEKEAGGVRGEWLRCQDEWSPVILEVADRDDFADSAAFRKAVLALPLSFTDRVLTFQSLGGDRFQFFAAQDKPPHINGAPVDYAPRKAFDSPFIQSVWNSGLVTLSKDGRTVVLDFN